MPRLVRLPVAEVDAPRAADRHGRGHHGQRLQRRVEPLPAWPATSRSGASVSSTRGLCAHRRQRVGDDAVAAAGVPLGEPVDERCGAGRARCGPWSASSPSGVCPWRRRSAPDVTSSGASRPGPPPGDPAGPRDRVASVAGPSAVTAGATGGRAVGSGPSRARRSGGGRVGAIRTSAGSRRGRRTGRLGHEAHVPVRRQAGRGEVGPPVRIRRDADSVRAHVRARRRRCAPRASLDDAAVRRVAGRRCGRTTSDLPHLAGRADRAAAAASSTDCAAGDLGRRRYALGQALARTTCCATCRSSRRSRSRSRRRWTTSGSWSVRRAPSPGARQSRPRPWRSSIMPSAAPSGPSASPEPGEHLLLAGQRQPGAAAGGAQRADLLRDGQPALHELDDLGVAGVDLAAQLADPRRGVGGGAGEAVTVLIGCPSGCGGRRTPGTRKRPGLFGPGASVAAVAQPAVTDTGSR